MAYYPSIGRLSACPDLLKFVQNHVLVLDSQIVYEDEVSSVPTLGDILQKNLWDNSVFEPNPIIRPKTT